MNRKKDEATGVVTSLEALRPLIDNPRRHTERGQGMLTRSVMQHGALRGIVVDEEGNILAGNGLVEAAADAGIERVRIIEVEGDELVAVQIKGMSAEDKARYALADNRTAELSGWDADVLREAISDGLDLDYMFSQDELDEVVRVGDPFHPTVTPTASWIPVDMGAIERAAEAHDHKFDGAANPLIRELECPNCHKTVYIRE